VTCCGDLVLLLAKLEDLLFELEARLGERGGGEFFFVFNAIDIFFSGAFLIWWFWSFGQGSWLRV